MEVLVVVVVEHDPNIRLGLGSPALNPGRLAWHAVQKLAAVARPWLVVPAHKFTVILQSDVESVSRSSCASKDKAGLGGGGKSQEGRGGDVDQLHVRCHVVNRK